MANFRLYKPNNNGTGAASQWDYRPNKNKKKRNAQLFLTITKQNGQDQDGNATFAWEKDKSQTIIMLLGLPDVGELLAVLQGRKDTLGTGKGLFHKNANGNSTLSLNFSPESKEKGPAKYFLKVGSQNTKGDLTTIAHTITVGEAAVLQEFLNSFLRFNFELSERVDTLEFVKQ